ncbi:alpha/beta hydrolase [Kineococcus sp. SYSU DK004]|uniref:alpha/beta hydrolase n=1 Tax=Kineococcus sp. SYSU DK004 TaxID=3383125 RepID=UPI003D7EACCD
MSAGAPAVPAPSRVVRRLDPVVLGEPDEPDAAVVFDDPDHPGERLVRGVTVPTLTPFLPAPGAGDGTAVVVAPGGALHLLAIDNEGEHVAGRLAARGTAAFVLRYRLVPTPADAAGFEAVLHANVGDRGRMAEVSRERRAPALADGEAALRAVRERAGEWEVDPARVGMLGFSAGAYVSLVTTLDTAPGRRPAFLAPVYPAWWGEVEVPADAPPLFLAWADDDELGETIVGSCVRLHAAWRRAGLPVEAHAYARGGHGFGVRAAGLPSDAWFDAFTRWTASVTA